MSGEATVTIFCGDSLLGHGGQFTKEERMTHAGTQHLD